jgi:hypothetical protein
MERRDLWRLPPDLQAMGWLWVSPESAEHRTVGRTWYTVVYARPFELGIDNETLAHQHKGGVWVRVSTNAIRSASWEEAYQEAIALMRDADARRWRPGQEP